MSIDVRAIEALTNSFPTVLEYMSIILGGTVNQLDSAPLAQW